MNVSVPVLVSVSGRRHTVRPVFHSGPIERDAELDRAMARLADELRKRLDELGKHGRHEELARYTFCPDLETPRLSLEIQLRRRVARVRVQLVTFRHFERTVAFCLGLPNRWFTVEREQTLRQRTEDVLTREYRALEKERGSASPEELQIERASWISTVELQIYPPSTHHSSGTGLAELLAGLAGGGRMDGEDELREVGRCLDSAYPEGLQKAHFRERELTSLRGALQARPRRPVLLLGAPGVGKTTVIHEHVRRVVAKRAVRVPRNRLHWWLSPQRLISGMSYIGQWQQRALAILAECRDRKHLLYFDDLLGLYKAGITVNSSVAVAQLIKPFIERQEISVLAEMTPAAFGILQELDRGLADRFQVVRIDEPSREDNLSILIHRMRDLENRQRCEFDTQALPLAVALQRRYDRLSAFPGKAARFLEEVALKYPNQPVSRDEVMEEFHRSSGLSVAFLDDRMTLERETVVEFLSSRVIGQPTAVEAMADVVSVAKARLDDPDRPLAAFLFLGPTGVGKTESAKALAEYLFGSDERLLRFDMNEYNGPDAPARLVGTFRRPEGLLTSAVAQNPFCVLLLDEIEKAHPDVIDLLLQVLDDGRLTDARGRTVDFCNAIVILTSNLGARDAGRSFGFAGGRDSDQGVYARAAQQFFRPEFFNRLDRVVAFGSLARDHVRSIGERILRDLLGRDGLVRRRLLLDISRGTLDQVAEEGYQPDLGARALKRVVERRIARPLARELAAIHLDRPAVVAVAARGDDLSVDVEPLQEAEYQGRWPEQVISRDPTALLQRAASAVERLEGELQTFRPPDVLDGTHHDPGVELYFDVKERLAEARSSLRDLLEASSRDGSSVVRPVNQNLRAKRKEARNWGKRWGGVLQELKVVEDVGAYLRDLRSTQSLPGNQLLDRVHAAVGQVSLIEAMIHGGPPRANEAVSVRLRSLGLSENERLSACRQFLELLVASMPLELQTSDDTTAVFEGPVARSLIDCVAGTRLIWRPHGGFALFAVEVLGVPGDGPSPRWPPVVRIREPSGTLDLHTGVSVSGARLTVAAHRSMVLPLLPWPEEMRG